MDLQEYIFSVINLIYRGCIRCIAMKGFAYIHEYCDTPLVLLRVCPAHKLGECVIELKSKGSSNVETDVKAWEGD
jgi:hypothetical protein